MSPVAPRVKVCCMQSLEEVKLAVELGASALGFVSAMPSGAGVIDESRIEEIVPAVPPSIATFLLTSRTDPAEIVEQQRRCRANTLQLCARVSDEAHAELRRALPGVALVQVVHVQDEASVAEAGEVARRVDGLLLDTGTPDGPVVELGGTGRTHDWALSARIVAAAAVPVFLAGGLRAENVGQAIREVRPFAVDLCNGVRTQGALDAVELERFMKAVGNAA